MKILQELCSIPTAPFVEYRVVEYVERFVRERKGLRLSRDEAGNLMVELAGKSRSAKRWVFAAHMDHPGMVTRRMVDKNTVEADFRGWVLAELMKGVKVRFFEEEREVAGKVVEVKADKTGRAKVVRARVSGPVAAGVAGMFDQGVGRTKGGKFYSRVCDDLAGAAAALTMLDELHKRSPESPVAVLLTRAEEEGFIGAIAAVLKPKLLRKSDRLIAIETSAMQPSAPQGKGPIIRLGDKTSIFNSSLSYFLVRTAEGMRKRNKRFQFQRAIMPGGTCEATVYDVYGYHAASICVALGNYHNMDREKKKIGPEFIDVKDWEGMVRLFLAVARGGHEYREGHVELRGKIEERFGKLQRFLQHN
jgi:putative aminopeptidase FrvX